MATLESIGACHAPRAGLVIEPMPEALLDDPLDYIFADHFRHRRVCAALRGFAAEGGALVRDAEAVSRFLRRDLFWHHDDEDDDLFPLLRQRAQPEDDLNAALDRLGEDHRRSEGMVEAITAVLAAPARDGTVRIDRKTRVAMNAFAAAEHRQLAIENGIVLAIARIRLTRADLARMSAAMRQRREAQA